VTFEFDPAKSVGNKIKHGIDFSEAQALWDFPVLQIPAKLTGDEARFSVIGKINRRFYTAVITYRGLVVRLISIRRSRKNEKELYEKSI
jgi:hypothetical protein